MAEKLEFDLTAKDNLSKALDSASNKAFSLEGALQTALGVFAGGAALKGIELVIDAVQGLVNVGKEAISAAAEQETATNNLNNALARSGNYTKQASAELEAFATTLQQTTVYQDDVITGNLALLESLTGLSVGGLKEGVRAATDFATVLGIDLETATRLVAKAANGNTEAFKRYGVEIQKGSSDSETFANTIKALNTQFGGAAANQLNTYAGALKALGNAQGDLLETLGAAVVKNPLVIAILNEIRSAFVELANPTSEATQEIKDFIVNGILFASSAMQTLLDMLDFVTVGIKQLIGVFQSVAGVIATSLIEPIETVIDGVLFLGSKIPGVGDSFKGLENPLSGATKALNDFTQAGVDSLLNSATQDNVFRTASTGIDNLTNRLINASADIAIAQGEVKNGAGGGKTDEDKQKALQQEQDYQTQLLSLKQQFANEEQVFKDTLAAQNLETDLARKTAEIEAQAVYQAQNLEALTLAELAKTDFLKTEAEKRLKQDTIIADAQLKALKIQQDKEKKLNDARVADKKMTEEEYQQVLSSSLSTIATLQTTGNKTLVAVGKAAALSQLAISAPVAVGKALELGPILGPVAAAAMTVAFAAQAARIAGVQFEQGGPVGGINGASVGADNRVATIRDGEFVLSGQDQKVLYDAIKSGNLGGGNIQVIIDGREVAVAVRNQIQSGFRLA